MHLRRLAALTMLVSACGSTDGNGQSSNVDVATSEGGAGSGQSGAPGTGGSGPSGSSGASGSPGGGGASAVDSGGADAIVIQGSVMEEPQGTAVDLPCSDLLAVNGADLFFLEPTALYKIGPMSTMRTLVVSAPGNLFQGAHYFAIDGNFVFWSDYQSIRKMSLAGGAPILLPVTNKDVNGEPNELIAHDSFLYFSHINDGNLYRVPIDGSAAEQLVGTFPASRKGTFSNGIAVLADRVYWAFDELVVSAPTGGGTVTTSAKAAKPYATLFGVAGTSIYWSGSDEGFMRTTLPSDTKTLLSDPVNSRVGDFDGTNVFGARANAVGNPHIVAVPAGGGAPAEVAAVGSQRAIKQVLVTTQQVYWTADRQCATPFQCPMGTCDARRVAKP